MAASSQTASSSSPNTKTPSLTFLLAFCLDFFSSFHCSPYALSCALADSLSLSIPLSFPELFTTCVPPPLLGSGEQKKMTTVSCSVCCHYQCPSPSLYTRGQMWRRDSGEFVMCKCKIRQQAQLTEPQGTQSQLLRTGLGNALLCH